MSGDQFIQRQRTYRREDGGGDVEDDAHDRVQVEEDEHDREEVREERDEEVDEAVLEEERHELRAAALDAEDELVHAHEEDEQVEDHRVDERRGEDRVVRARHDAARAGDPGRLHEHALQDERPVPEDDEDDRVHDALVVRPERHTAERGGRGNRIISITERRAWLEGGGARRGNTYVRIDRLMLARPDADWPMSWLKV